MQHKDPITPERAEELKLKAKYPNLGQKPGGSDFLMKRLQKGVRTAPALGFNLPCAAGGGSSTVQEAPSQWL